MPLGAPVFDYDDKVSFSIISPEGEVINLEGKIYIIDAHGIFADNSRVYYDIFVEDDPHCERGCLYKHIPENDINFA